MRRALDTARPIAAACGLELRIAPELHERKMGALSGMLKTEGWSRYAEEKDRWKAGELSFAHEGGETFLELRERVAGAFETVVSQSSGTIFMVSHGVVIRALLSGLIEGIEPAHFDEIGIDNLALNDLRFDGVCWRAEALNWHPGEHQV
jgi:probable phosphoglycerate mutase